MDLSTKYMGLELRTPLVVAAGPISEKIDGIRALEDAGAAAVVLFSLFEEQLTLSKSELLDLVAAGVGSRARAMSLAPERGHLSFSPLGYLEHIRRAKEAVDVPIIASLNGTPRTDYTPFARLLEQAGADALELNLYFQAVDFDRSSEDIERACAATLEAVGSVTKLPIAVKLLPYFTSLGHFAARLAGSGARALVLFNRFAQPDFDLDDQTVIHRMHLSSHRELLLPLHAIAYLFDRVPLSLAASGGIDDSTDAIKAIMAGADVAMLCSTLIKHGTSRVRLIEDGMRAWLEARDHTSLSEIRGRLSHRRFRDPAAFERVHYMLTLDSIKG